MHRSNIIKNEDLVKFGVDMTTQASHASEVERVSTILSQVTAVVLHKKN